ncbi:MAG TPA: hypothetical protein VFJ85_05360 [Acidimicrobiales bacterium]|nr:hypothetical protein [Acidimicrobiales bacterium]
MTADLDELRERLQAIADDLADLALERLRAAVDLDDPAPAAEERRLTRARRAVEKAISVLGDRDGDDDG